jgi:hypothetical protein
MSERTSCRQGEQNSTGDLELFLTHHIEAQRIFTYLVQREKLRVCLELLGDKFLFSSKHPHRELSVIPLRKPIYQILLAQAYHMTLPQRSSTNPRYSPSEVDPPGTPRV